MIAFVEMFIHAFCNVCVCVCVLFCGVSIKFIISFS